MELSRCLQHARRHFIDSRNEFDDNLIIRNAHFAYSNWCTICCVPSYWSLITSIVSSYLSAIDAMSSKMPEWHELISASEQLASSSLAVAESASRSRRQRNFVQWIAWLVQVTMTWNISNSYILAMYGRSISSIGMQNSTTKSPFGLIRLEKLTSFISIKVLDVGCIITKIFLLNSWKWFRFSRPFCLRNLCQRIALYSYILPASCRPSSTSTPSFWPNNSKPMSGMSKPCLSTTEHHLPRQTRGRINESGKNRIFMVKMLKYATNLSLPWKFWSLFGVFRFGWNENLQSSLNYWKQRDASFDLVVATELLRSTTCEELKELTVKIAIFIADK